MQTTDNSDTKNRFNSFDIVILDKIKL